MKIKPIDRNYRNFLSPVVGFIFLAGLISFINKTIAYGVNYQWIWLSLYFVIDLALASATFDFLLYPLRNKKIVAPAYRIFSYITEPLLKICVCLVSIIVPYLIFAILFAFSWIFLAVAVSLGLKLVLNSASALYIVLTLTFFLFALFGEKLIRFAMFFYDRVLGFSGFVPLFNSLFIRFLMYIALIGFYFVANVENFSTQTVINYQFWIEFRKIIIEVFLTYVIIDAAFVAWNDFMEKIKGKDIVKSILQKIFEKKIKM